MEFVTFPAIKVLLLTVFFVSLLVEIKTGGMGVAFLFGIIAAGIFFGSHYLNGLVSIYPIGVFLVGVICIFIEMLSPTVGIFAGIGLVALLYSFVLTMGGNLDAIYAIFFALVLAVLIFILLLKHLPSSKLWSKIILSNRSTRASGYVSSVEEISLLGKYGICQTDLRPAGKAMIDKVLYDVVSEGDFILKGEKIVVVKVAGSRIVVIKTE